MNVKVVRANTIALEDFVDLHGLELILKEDSHGSWSAQLTGLQVSYASESGCSFTSAIFSRRGEPAPCGPTDAVEGLCDAISGQRCRVRLSNDGTSASFIAPRIISPLAKTVLSWIDTHAGD